MNAHNAMGIGLPPSLCDPMDPSCEPECETGLEQLTLTRCAVSTSVNVSQAQTAHAFDCVEVAARAVESMCPRAFAFALA
jgi:hypothetical protein